MINYCLKDILMKLYYLRIALRSLYRQKFYSTINILGFAIGIAVFFFISLYIIDQYAYDRWPENHHNIYRIEKGDWGLLGSAHGPFAVRTLPEAQMVCRVWTMNYHLSLKHEEKLFALRNVVFADSTFAQMFSMPFIAGNPGTALTDPRSIVLTRSAANTIFGSIDVIGQVLRYNDLENLVVTGIMEDVSHFHIAVSAVVPLGLHGIRYSGEGFDFMYNWGGYNFLTYISLVSGTSAREFEQKLNDAYFDEYFSLYGRELDRDFFLRPLNDVYFASIKHISPTLSGQRQVVRLFLAIALFILLFAMVNFINLSTARASLRAREVGISRLLGSHRLSLIGRFLTESLVITFLAVALALAFMETGMNWFRNFAGVTIELSELGFLRIALILAAGSFFTGLLSGLYPAIYLTSVVPVDVLKGHMSRGTRGAFFRKALIIFQFVISISLITATIVIHRQLNYMQQKDKGIHIDDTIIFRLEENTFRQWSAFRDRLLQHPSIVGVARSAQVPGSITWQESARGNSQESKQFTMMIVDANYLSMSEVEVLAGRYFSEDYRSSFQKGVLLNQQAVNYFEYEGSYEDIIGRAFDWDTQIIGILRDFHYNSPHNPIGPLVIRWGEDFLWNLSIRLQPEAYTQALEHVASVWQEFEPAIPLVTYYLPDIYSEDYQKNRQMSQIFMIFSIFAIVIACLGLFALSSFMAERRQREMAVRKVMGARVITLVLLLLKDFMKQVLIAFFIAVPISWFYLQQWLDSFPYRTTIDLMPFLMALLAAILITLLTVAWNALKVSKVNPGHALKYQ
jgi:putative ABC transport system permease protein